MEMSHLHIPRILWDQTLSLLRDRSNGRRESGAVVLGNRTSTTQRFATKVVGYHELCDDRATEVFVELSEDGKLRLYSQLEREKLQMVAMVHTHPEGWVGLSPIDQANQLSSRVGFWSIVLPHFGRQPWDLDLIGFHIRQSRGWHQLGQDERLLAFHLV
jgi:proteasome lid subunit RPN8/RPN11